MSVQILYEAADWLIARKPVGLVSEQTAHGDGFADLLAAQNNGYIGVIHRLDRGVGGVMLYAKTPAAAAKLSQAVQAHQIKKQYLAVVQGIPAQPAGELRDLLYYDRGRNKVFPVKRERRGVKEAILTYRLLQTIAHPDTKAPVSLLSVEPVTGRTHQIRVQFASRGLPLLGDRRYGGGAADEIALCCYGITLPMQNGNADSFCHTPIGAPWEWFSALPK